MRYLLFVARELREWMAQLGFRNVDEMIGQVQCLDVGKAVNHWKQKGLDFSEILHKPDVPHALYNCEKQRLEAGAARRARHEAARARAARRSSAASPW